jgi:hypothetical protein
MDGMDTKDAGGSAGSSLKSGSLGKSLLIADSPPHY